MLNLDYIKKKFQNNFQPIVSNMIDALGADTCTITMPPTSEYDLLKGEIEASDTETDSINVALIPTTKDDMVYIPEGFAKKDIRKILSNIEITEDMIITSDFDGNNFEMIRPSIPYRAGNLTHCYRTYVARVEN